MVYFDLRGNGRMKMSAWEMEMLACQLSLDTRIVLMMISHFLAQKAQLKAKDE
jgi:hypothetical protein